MPPLLTAGFRPFFLAAGAWATLAMAAWMPLFTGQFDLPSRFGLARWCGIATLEEPLLLVLHVGYLWLVVGVALLGLSLITAVVPTAAALHALTAGAMGTMILAVMTRATLGHTGRVLRADRVTMLIYALVSASAVVRIVAAWMGDGQIDLYEVAALAWVGAFALFVAEYGPMLLAPRR